MRLVTVEEEEKEKKRSSASGALWLSWRETTAEGLGSFRLRRRHAGMTVSGPREPSAGSQGQSSAFFLSLRRSPASLLRPSLGGSEAAALTSKQEAVREPAGEDLGGGGGAV